MQKQFVPYHIAKEMREIKFRIWNPFLKLMIYWERISFEPICTIFNTDLIPLQYTGLKDKNGKEIYEGDIVQFYRNEPFQKRKLVKCGIVFHEGMFCLKYDGYINKWPLNIHNYEVIGNIYEPQQF